MRMIFWGVVLIVIGALLAVRLMPTDAARWHQPVAATSDKDFAGGAIRVIEAGEGDLAQLAAIAEATPRTQKLAGSVEDGRITYVTRSKWIGFPDYTTIERSGDQIRLYARLRFGNRDFDVNRHRIETWISRLRT